MSEKSYFHNGTAAGDAVNAPYDQETFAHLVQGTLADGAFVLPDGGNLLAVAPGAGRTVTVAEGEASIYGYWYLNSAPIIITLAANTSDYPRLDAIIVEVDTEAGTAEARVLQGVPGETPSPPPLNTCATLLQLPLAYVALADSFAAVDAKYVYDQRRFLDNVYHRNFHSRQNDFSNGLFIAWCDSETSGTARRPMPRWVFDGAGTPQSTKDAERFPSMLDGRCVQYYTAPETSTEGFKTTVLTDENTSQMFTFSMLLQVNDGYTSVEFGGTSIDYIASSEVYQVIIRASLTGYQEVKISGTAASAKFGDLRLAQGYCIAQQATEGTQVIMYDKPVYMHRDYAGSSPTALTGLSTGNTTAGYFGMFGPTEDFYPTLFYRARGHVVQLKVNDSGSAATSLCYAALYFYGWLSTLPFLRVDVSGVVNDVPRYRTGIIRSDKETNVGGVGTFAVVASGGSTLDIDFSLVGVIL